MQIGVAEIHPVRPKAMPTTPAPPADESSAPATTPKAPGMAPSGAMPHFQGATGAAPDDFAQAAHMLVQQQMAQQAANAAAMQEWLANQQLLLTFGQPVHPMFAQGVVQVMGQGQMMGPAVMGQCPDPTQQYAHAEQVAPANHDLQQTMPTPIGQTAGVPEPHHYAPVPEPCYPKPEVAPPAAPVGVVPMPPNHDDGQSHEHQEGQQDHWQQNAYNEHDYWGGRDNSYHGYGYQKRWSDWSDKSWTGYNNWSTWDTDTTWKDTTWDNQTSRQWGLQDDHHDEHTACGKTGPGEPEPEQTELEEIRKYSVVLDQETNSFPCPFYKDYVWIRMKKPPPAASPPHIVRAKRKGGVPHPPNDPPPRNWHNYQNDMEDDKHED
eukprot:s2630_g5.t1